MNNKSFWYIACESKKLGSNQPIASQILDEWIVLFRDQSGAPHALQDRCLHRGSQLSRGSVHDGCLKCPYHGWTYRGNGEVASIPAESIDKIHGRKRTQTYAVREQQGYIYVNLDEHGSKRIAPFELPYFEQKGFSHIRLINHFRNNVTNCVENFVDIPHTVFVHPTIFRKEKKTKQRIGVKVERVGGSVIVNYQMETDNFGAFSWFLNPKGQEIFHQDSFHMPNVTHVEYIFGPHRHFNIISQSVPIGHGKTTVYTDLIYNYGIWNSICKPIIAWQAQKIIDQDIEVLNNQWLTLEKFGHQFMNSPVDIIHILIESIRNEIEKGQDPTKLEPRTCEAEFWI